MTGIPRFQVVEGDELSESQAMTLCELGGEEPPQGFLVIDTEDEGDGIVAYLPRPVAGITPADLAQRVAVLVAIGEPSEPPQPPMRVEISLDPIRRPGEGEPRAIVSVRDGYGQTVPDAVLYLGPNEMVAVTVEKEGPPQIGERQRLGPKEVDMGGQS